MSAAPYNHAIPAGYGYLPSILCQRKRRPAARPTGVARWVRSPNVLAFLPDTPAWGTPLAWDVSQNFPASTSQNCDSASPAYPAISGPNPG